MRVNLKFDSKFSFLPSRDDGFKNKALEWIPRDLDWTQEWDGLYPKTAEFQTKAYLDSGINAIPKPS